MIREISPFLTRYAKVRTASETIPGHYSDELKMWAVNTSIGDMPIIEAKTDLLEITTKTKVNLESDDELPSPLLELSTKTEANIESDDDDCRAVGLLELTTKTAAQLESDDEDSGGVRFI